MPARLSLFVVSMGRRQKQEFLTFFPNCAGCPRYVISLLKKGVGQGCIVHSALWKFFLLILPEARNGYVKPEQWIEILNSKRLEFEKTRSELSETQAVDIDADPLDIQGKSSDHGWRQIFAEQELKSQIARDTVRAFPEVEFFQSPENLQLVEDMLFLFCKKHPSYGYPQGLHELAAYIFLVFSNEMKRNGTESDIISVMFCSKYVFTDAFLCFEKLAELIEPLYRAGHTTSDLAYSAELAQRIQSEYLAKESRDLADKLKHSGVTAQSYMLKWLRLLFLGVFDIESVKSMWDLIIAYLPSLEIISNTCVALLMNAKGKLMKSDPTEILQFLFHYPPVPYPARFVISAAEMMKGQRRSPSKAEVPRAVADRLSEIASRMAEVARANGWEKMMPFVTELKRTRDVLTGLIAVDEMLPIEQALQLETPTTLVGDESSDDEPDGEEAVGRFVRKSVSMPIAQPREVNIEETVEVVTEKRRVRLFDEDVPKPKRRIEMPQSGEIDLLGNAAKPDEVRSSGLLFEENRPSKDKRKLKRKTVEDLFK